MTVKGYRELVVWQKAMDLVVQVYELTRRFPREEMYGLSAQMRRAAVSVPSNIAEGQGRGAGSDFVYFLRIGQGSIQELETQVLLAARLDYVSSADTDRILLLSSEVAKLLRGLRASVE
jgi:four helix bundle protein